MNDPREIQFLIWVRYNYEEHEKKLRNNYSTNMYFCCFSTPCLPPQLFYFCEIYYTIILLYVSTSNA
jgi:hypothetical protein